MVAQIMEDMITVKKSNENTRQPSLSLHTHGSWVYCVCYVHIKHTNKYRPNQLFLLSRGVHTTAFSSTLQDIMDLIELKTPIFMH
jgi:hypothetical protein